MKKEIKHKTIRNKINLDNNFNKLYKEQKRILHIINSDAFEKKPLKYQYSMVTDLIELVVDISNQLHNILIGANGLKKILAKSKVKNKKKIENELNNFIFKIAGEKAHYDDFWDNLLDNKEYKELFEFMYHINDYLKK